MNETTRDRRCWISRRTCGSTPCRCGARSDGVDKEQSSDALYEWVIGDLLDSESVASAATGIDVICHLGAIGDVYLASEQPQLAAAVNVTGSANVAGAAARAGAKVVYASTWEVYGEPEYQPIDETQPLNPDHPAASRSLPVNSCCSRLIGSRAFL